MSSDNSDDDYYVTRGPRHAIFLRDRIAMEQQAAGSIAARVEMVVGSTEEGRMVSIYSELDMKFPPMPDLVRERLAVVRLLPKGERLANVGKRQGTDVFYLYFTEEEVNAITQTRIKYYVEHNARSVPFDPRADAMAFQVIRRTGNDRSVGEAKQIIRDKSNT